MWGMRTGSFLSAALLLLGASQAEPARRKVLIVDGQSNHADWPLQTKMVKEYLEQTGLFAVEVATSPPAGESLEAFRPKFAGNAVVLSLYNGGPWPEETRRDFEAYVRGGGGFVSVHMADNAFPDWPEYNRMIGLGGWYRRSEKSGPWVYFEGERLVRNPAPGIGGSHGVEHAFPVDARDPEHPVMRGLPARWMHERDELYDRLRGPAEDMSVLATAFSDPATGGSGRHEPVLMALRYGEGRVFHTTLGHGPYSRECVGFIVTLQRGAEWAASGKVTQPVPADFPTADRVRVRLFGEGATGTLALAVSADGRTFAAGGEDGIVRFRDLRGAGPSRTLREDGSTVTSAAFSPDGAWLAVAGRRLRLWNLDRADEKRPIPAPDWPETVSFSPAPEGHLLATGGATVDVWDVRTGERVFRRPGFARRVAWSPDGKTLAAAHADGKVRLHARDGSGEAAAFGANDQPLDALGWRGGGMLLASGGRDGVVRLWDPATRGLVREIQPKAGWINDLAFSPDRRLLAVAHRRLTLWDVESGLKVADFEGPGGRATAVAFAPDARTVAFAGAGPDVTTREVPGR